MAVTMGGLAVMVTATVILCASLGRTTGHPELDPLPGRWIGQLHDLHRLTILDVMLSQGSAQVIFSNMTKLTALALQNADLSGPFPAIWSATNLSTLNLSNNSLVGPLPPNLALLTQLTQLNLQLNVMSGSIPEAIGELRNLDTLRLNGNLFSSSVPASITNLSTLTSLSFVDCRLASPLASAIVPWPQALALSLTSFSVTVNNSWWLAFGVAVVESLRRAIHSIPYSVYAAESRFGYVVVTTGLLSALIVPVQSAAPSPSPSLARTKGLASHDWLIIVVALCALCVCFFILGIIAIYWYFYRVPAPPQAPVHENHDCTNLNI